MNWPGGDRMKMKACEKHNDSIVIFKGDVCPFCEMETELKTIGEEIEKYIRIMRQMRMAAEETGLKSV